MKTINSTLTQEAYETLVESAHDHSLRHGFTVYLIGETGLRNSEAAHFTPDWFDPATQTVSVPRTDSGWSPKVECRVRQIPITQTASENFTHYLEALEDEAFNVSSSAIYNRVKTASEIAGIEDVTPSVLQDMYGGRLRSNGVPIQSSANIMGHNRISSREWMHRDKPFEKYNYLVETDGPDIWNE